MRSYADTPVGLVSANADPATVVIVIELPLGNEWVPLTKFHPREIGMTPEDIAEEIQLLRYQSRVDIPDDLSSLGDSEG